MLGWEEMGGGGGEGGFVMGDGVLHRDKGMYYCPSLSGTIIFSYLPYLCKNLNKSILLPFDVPKNSWAQLFKALLGC